jgi:asparagine synthase (glutamine-hydrolysing)
MCGICGIIDLSGGRGLESRIQDMSDSLSLRGPDDSGTYFNYRENMRAAQDISAGLGHRRLSIIDLKSGRQPMHNENRSLWVILNGEIYNYPELRADLKKKGHLFTTLSDTEVVVHLYEEYHSECVRYLRGMFAFAVWDEPNKTLFLARDRIGKKPLLYHYKNGRFIFSSEFASILKSRLIGKEINFEALDHYLTLGYISAPLTIYKDIFKVPHAHTLTLKEGQVKINKYWDLEYYPKSDISEEEAGEELMRLFEESVSMRLRSDVPLGSFLSGGVDSSGVVAMMAKLSSQKVKTFSIGFDEKDFCELKYARKIAGIFNTDHHEFVVKPDALSILPLLVERYGEPYADSSCIPTYYVSRETREFVTVALNGDGGDESFAGYDRYHAMLMAQNYMKWHPLFRKAARGICALFPDSADQKNTLRRIKRFFEAAELPADKRYLRWTGIWNARLKELAYDDTFKTRIASGVLEADMGAAINKNSGWHLVDRLLKRDVSSYLPYDLLVKVDIASMANSLEARSPLLDHKFMEFAARLPVRYKLKGRVKKYILKKALEGSIPKENLYRRKMGFAIPAGNWLRNELKGLLYDTVLSSKALGRGYFKAEAIKGMVNEHTRGKSDYTYQIWSLLMLELWHRRFID